MEKENGNYYIILGMSNLNSANLDRAPYATQCPKLSQLA